MPSPSLRERLRNLDWRGIEDSLAEWGYARGPVLLDETECRELVGLYKDDARFRTRIDMERHRFGRGDYAYFRNPLPKLVRELRTHAYFHLAPIANRWMEALGRPRGYPPSLRGFLTQCHAAGQSRPTPLLLHYEAGGYNRLHQDLYGSLAFPLQLSVMLSQTGSDYEGGEFLLVEQQARMQSRGHVVPLERGELVIFPASERPTEGKRGTLRAHARHGMSRVTWGSRYVLGIIFHDAR